MLKVQCINGAWHAVDESDVMLLESVGLGDMAFLSFRLLSDHMATFGIDTVKHNEITYKFA
jgi:hypothetical protein